MSSNLEWCRLDLHPSASTYEFGDEGRVARARRRGPFTRRCYRGSCVRYAEQQVRVFQLRTAEGAGAFYLE